MTIDLVETYIDCQGQCFVYTEEGKPCEEGGSRGGIEGVRDTETAEGNREPENRGKEKKVTCGLSKTSI